MGTAPEPVTHSVRSPASWARASATPAVSATWWRARVSPGPTRTPTSGPRRVAKACSSVGLSPTKRTAEAPTRWRSDSRARPLSVSTTRSSTASSLWWVWTPSRAAGPASMSSRACWTSSAVTAAVVEGDRGGLHLELGAGGPPGDLGQVGLDPGPEVELAGREALAEAEVELAAVAAHEVDLGGQAGETGQVAQGAAGDHRHVGVGQGGQGPEGDHGVGPGMGRHRVVDDGGDGPVVVAGHQELGRAGQQPELGLQVVGGGLGHEGRTLPPGPEVLGGTLPLLPRSSAGTLPVASPRCAPTPPATGTPIVGRRWPASAVTGRSAPSA